MELLLYIFKHTQFAALDTLGGASSDPPESQDTVTCRLDSILIRSSCCSFSSSSIVLRKTYSIQVKLQFGA